MEFTDLKSHYNDRFYDALEKHSFPTLRPSQEKAVKAGLYDKNNLLICTPTGSGKTYVAELAIMHAVMQKTKALYVVPLKALASEKYKSFKEKYEGVMKTALAIGDPDSTDTYLENYDCILVTSEKLDSLIRHRARWLQQVSCVVVDEIHLLNDPGRGPTLEIILTLLKDLLKDVQLIGLSATIGNPQELAEWLGAKLVEDDWRPVELKKGIYDNGEVSFP